MSCKVSEGRRLSSADSTSASLSRAHTAGESADILSSSVLTADTARAEHPPDTWHIVVSQAEQPQGTSGSCRMVMAFPRNKVVSYTPPHEINEVDIRNRSTINSAIDADKRYIKFLFALLDDVPADIRSIYNVK